MKLNLKATIAALGASLVLASGAATAGVTWSFPLTSFEDDDIDFVLEQTEGDGLQADSNGTLDVGDVLVAIFEINSAGGSDLGGDELTGISVIEIGFISEPDPILGTSTILFQPYSGGLNEVLDIGANGVDVGTSGDAGGGAMIAMWLDANPDLLISQDNVVNNTVSCSTLSMCIDQSANGDLFQVDGFAGDDADEIWFASNAQTDTDVVLQAQTSTILGAFNASLSILVNATGQELAENAVECFPVCGAGGDGFADVVGSGTINGGGAGVGGLGGLVATGLAADGAVATSDFQLTKAPVPTPGSLALLAAGLLSIGAFKRRGSKA